MPPANIENDPFFELLTDALRAGPGSPQWHEAVTTLRGRGSEGDDEMRLLIEARENLESGRGYRAVRAGQGFTRKLMGQIENASASGPGRGIPTATLIAVVCGLLIVGVVAYVVNRLAPHEVGSSQQIDNLQDKSHRFFDTMTTATFAGAMPEGWVAIGSLPLDEANGLRPAAAADKGAKDLGGGVRWSKTVEPAQAFAMEVSVDAPEPSGALLLEAFVSADANFSADKGTSSHDLVWQLHGREQRVLLGGSSQSLLATPTFNHGDMVRLILDQNVAIIEVVSAGGKTQRLWAGPHDLGKNPRYVGVRFLQTGASGKADISVKEIKVTTSPG
ncbi:MAG TPA: hypothetical protein VG326_07910 [Tepidisphaeraceae bacterium]|jgi:hypothetical protein|nr:hypothetical protein [Tepidisphaeraceae bacterium]